FLIFNLVESFAKFSSEITVVLDHLPESNDSRITDPVVKIFFSDRPHFRPTAPNKMITWTQFAKRAHQGGAVIVATHFTGDKIDRLRGHSRIGTIAEHLPSTLIGDKVAAIDPSRQTHRDIFHPWRFSELPLPRSEQRIG